MAGRSRNRLTQRSLSEIDELSGIGQSYCDIFGSRLNQAKRTAPKRLEQRGSKSGACLPSVPVRAKVRFPPNSDCSRRGRQGLFSIAASVKLRLGLILSPF